jgi:Ca2+-binding RTX toxin-like protein
MVQSGADTVLSFEGADNTKVTLKNVALDALDNPSNSAYGLVFDGQTAPTDSFDVLKAGTQISQVGRDNTVTFLNELGNTVNGRDNSADVINGQGGDDTLRGLSGDDLLRGGVGNDHLVGGTGNDRLDGGAGHDDLQGDDGNDILIGGAGNDWLAGGAGADKFVFARGGHADIVNGFEAGSDKLDLSAFGFGDMAGLTKSATMTAGANMLWVDFGSGDRLTVYGITKLTADNVIF